MRITYDHYSLWINGQRILIRSGAMHYFRLPHPQLWWDRLFKLKAAGYNTVDLYFCWGYHSTAPGEYDYTGIRDIRKLLAMTQALGFYVIARPGPYINAEYSGGGFPGWLLAKKDLPLRNRRDGAFEWSDEYMGYVDEWWRQIIPILNTAPNIILMQIENEYGTHEVEPDYMRRLAEMTRALGVTVPLFHNDLYVAGLYADIVDIYAFDNYSVTQFETDWREMPEVFQVLDTIEENLRPFCQNRPLMAAELQAGWFGAWKGYHYEKIIELLGREHIGISTKTLLAQGLTIFNHYKAIGGTNWDHIGSIETYTSYDFGAPISETGLNTPRLFEAKSLNYWLQSFDFAATDRRESFPLSLSNMDCFYGVRALHDQAHAHQKKSQSSEPLSTKSESCWLFLRNLSPDSRVLTVDQQYAITVKPFEVLILPYRIPLKCGVELYFCSTEPLYQTAQQLVLKANRPVTLCLRFPTHLAPDAFPSENSNWPHKIQIRACKPQDYPEPETSLEGWVCWIIQCPELEEAELYQLNLGPLYLLLLGKRLVDTFWIQSDTSPTQNESQMKLVNTIWNEPPKEPQQETFVIGPELSLQDGSYGFTPETRQWFYIEGETPVQSISIDAPAIPFEVPRLNNWQLFDEAPELNHFEAMHSKFTPVINGSPDFDANGLYEGSAWYTVDLGSSKQSADSVKKPEMIAINARHIWAVFLNGELLGEGHQLVLIAGMAHPDPTPLAIPASLWKDNQENHLLIFVNGLGHPKGFYDNAQTPQGLLSLSVDGIDRSLDVYILGGINSRRPLLVNHYEKTHEKNTGEKNAGTSNEKLLSHFERSPLVRMSTTFSLPHYPDREVPWGIKLQNVDFKRIDIYLNETLVGRYWQECRRQEVFYLPSGLLRIDAGESNTLDLILMNFKPSIEKARLVLDSQQVTLHPYQVLTRILPPSLHSDSSLIS